tara:strand:+ start:621 stop:1244 length:624 start_codon:yes stop_codon:yes gene_type:complete
MRRKRKLTRREIKPKKKKIKNKRTKRPYWCRITRKRSKERGKKVNKMCEPSSGGMGKRLNTASKMFRKTMKLNMNTRDSFKTPRGRNRRANPKARAMARLEPGPAKLTKADPYFLSLRFKGFTGTGFAQPRIIPPPVIWLIKIRNPGSKIEPTRSRCGRGFKVNLPACFAVGSPKALATTPWETSCKTIEKIRITIRNKNSIRYTVA